MGIRKYLQNRFPWYIQGWEQIETNLSQYTIKGNYVHNYYVKFIKSGIIRAMLNITFKLVIGQIVSP